MENKVNNFEAVMNASGLTDSIIVEASKSWRNHATKTINGYNVEYYKGRKQHVFEKGSVGYVQEPLKEMKISFNKKERESAIVVAHEAFHMEEYYSGTRVRITSYNTLYAAILNNSTIVTNKWTTVNGNTNNVVFEGSDEELFNNILYSLLPREIKANIFSFWKMKLPDNTLQSALCNKSALEYMQTRIAGWNSEDVQKWWNKNFDHITAYESYLLLDNLKFNVTSALKAKTCQTEIELATLFNEIDVNQCEIFKRTITL